MIRIKKILSLLLLLIVVILSGVGMMTTPNGWSDTMWTCIWCLALVTLSDKIDTHFDGK